MRYKTAGVTGLLIALILASAACTSAQPVSEASAAPVVIVKAAQGGAVVASLSSTTPGATIYYTVDGTTPTAASPRFESPFLVASPLTVKAIAINAGDRVSVVTTKTFATHIHSGTLVWQDEFSNSTGTNQQPDPAVWGYDTGARGFGNHELEDYCAWGSAEAPCDPAQPNAFVGTDGYLHIIARKTVAGTYTSARMKTQGLFGVRYGRVEARIRVPEGQGIWPAFWSLGNNIATAGWPACGEMDIMERVNSALSPDWNEGSVHGPGFTGDVGLGKKYFFPAGQTAAGWHTYGVIWTKDSAAFFVDDPAKPYVTYNNPSSLSGLSGAVWPFDGGESQFLILNVAVGGDWPGAPDGTTVFPKEMLVDYVRVYTN